MRLLVVEDEKDLNEIITKQLRSNGYVTDSCFDGLQAYEYLTVGNYDGAVLDVMLPKLNGFDLLQKVRGEGVQTPILFLTARTEKKDIIRGLDLGADDYLVKPFDLEELLARIRVMMRKRVDVRENIYRCGDLEVNSNTHSVTRGGREINLSAKEFQILLFLVRNKNMVVTREQIENNIWQFDKESNSNVIDVYIRYLRKKIDDNFDSRMIHTIRGVGYQLKASK